MTQEEAEEILRVSWGQAGDCTLRIHALLGSFHEHVDSGHDRSGLSLAELVDLLDLAAKQLGVAVAQAQRVGQTLLGIKMRPKGPNVVDFAKERSGTPPGA